MTQTTERTSKQYFKELRVLHKALLIGQVVISIILYILARNTAYLAGIDTGDYLVLGMMLVGFVSSSIVFKKLVEKAKETKDLKDKLGAYRTALIAKWAALEGPVLIGIIFFFMSSNLAFLLVAGVLMAFFSTTGSSIDKTIEDLSLNMDEQVLVRRPDEIVARYASK